MDLRCELPTDSKHTMAKTKARYFLAVPTHQLCYFSGKPQHFEAYIELVKTSNKKEMFTALIITLSPDSHEPVCDSVFQDSSIEFSPLVGGRGNNVDKAYFTFQQETSETKIWMTYLGIWETKYKGKRKGNF